jgi:hypothetical protein
MQTALLMVLLLKKSGNTRARVSVKTIKLLANRERLRTVFLKELIDSLNDLGVLLIELDRGGYGLLLSTSLEGAPAITVKKYMSSDLRDVRTGKLSFEAIEKEVCSDSFYADPDEENA